VSLGAEIAFQVRATGANPLSFRRLSASISLEPPKTPASDQYTIARSRRLCGCGRCFGFRHEPVASEVMPLLPKSPRVPAARRRCLHRVYLGAIMTTTVGDLFVNNRSPKLPLKQPRRNVRKITTVILRTQPRTGCSWGTATTMVSLICWRQRLLRPTSGTFYHNDGNRTFSQPSVATVAASSVTWAGMEVPGEITMAMACWTWSANYTGTKLSFIEMLAHESGESARRVCQHRGRLGRL
jgi:hypothetical protein